MQPLWKIWQFLMNLNKPLPYDSTLTHDKNSQKNRKSIYKTKKQILQLMLYSVVKTERFSPKKGTQQVFSMFFYYVVPKVLTSAITQEKEIKCIQIQALRRDSNNTTHKRKNDKLDFLKIKHFGSVKTLLKDEKASYKLMENICKPHI